LIDYLSEPSLNSELILVNNAKKLKDNPKLFNDTHLDEIMKLRDEYEKLNLLPGLQKKKRKIRNKIRDLSSKTYVYRDTDIFGEMILNMMDNILKRPNFSNYSFKNEMKSLATEHILKYTWKFDSYRQSEISGQYASAFTYLSTIIFNAFIATINKHNKENEKAKQDFLETQKLFHLDPKRSTYGEDYSTPKKEVHIRNINEDLFTEIQKIPLDEKDILIKYPKDYLITLEEYEKITKYSEENNINLVIIKDDNESG
jgi:hypothetical protein